MGQRRYKLTTTEHEIKTNLLTFTEYMPFLLIYEFPDNET